MYECKCSCGNIKTVSGKYLRYSKNPSCGCKKGEWRRKLDIVGEKFGMLTVVERADDYITPSGAKLTRWRCRCDCGSETIVTGTALRSGSTRSCGCLRDTLVGNLNKSHGESKTRLYRIRLDMIKRCYREQNKEYEQYGGRGIRVCDEWLHSYEKFKEWAISAGYDENEDPVNMSIDRIDVDGDYCPENCRWVDRKTQARNTTRNAYFTYNGETKCLSEWCEELNISYGAVRARINERGWSFEKAITTPIKNHPVSIEYNGITKTLDEWCAEYGMDKSLVYSRMYKDKWSFEEAITTPVLKTGLKRNSVLYDGKSISEWSDEVGISRATIEKRLDSGWSIEDAIKTPIREQIFLTFNGKTQNVADWCKELGLNVGTVRGRLKKGWSTEEALTGKGHNLSKGVPRMLFYDGREQSVTGWARELNINKSTLFSRLNKGWSVEEALTGVRNKGVVS